MKSWFVPAESLNAIKNLVNITPENNWNKVGEPKSGSFNTVNFFVENVNPNNKKSIRTSTNPIYMIEPKTNTIYNEFGTPVTTKEKKEALRNKSNWEQASIHKLSPELFYYGYFKQTGLFKGINVYKIYLCVISEGFTSDLSSYYRNPENIVYKDPPQGWVKRVSTARHLIPHGLGIDRGELHWWNPQTATRIKIEEKHRILSKTDIHIANQLINLLQKTAATMNVLCFDLKAANCVIDTSTYEVKLIDWDADWCIQYDFLKSKTYNKKDKSIGKLSGLISAVFMANQFLKWNNWNIFAKYFSDETYKTLLTPTDAFYRRPLIPSLKTLFCSPMDNGEGKSGNQIMTMHYQKLVVEEAGMDISNMNAKQFKKKCRNIFDVLWKKTKILTGQKKYVSEEEAKMRALPSVPKHNPGEEKEQYGGKTYSYYRRRRRKTRKYKKRKTKRKKGGNHSDLFKTLMKRNIKQKIKKEQQRQYKKIQQKIKKTDTMNPAQLMRKKTIKLSPQQVKSGKNIPYFRGGRKKRKTRKHTKN